MISECVDYGEIKTAKHRLKIFRKMLNRRIHAFVEIDSKQFSLFPGKEIRYVF